MWIKIRIYCTSSCDEMVDCGESDKMIKTNGKIDKLDINPF